MSSRDDDVRAITALVDAYGECVGRGDLEGIVELFAKGAVSGDAHPDKAVGREGVRALYRATLAGDGQPRRLRVSTYDLVIAVDDSAGTATCRSCFTVLPPGDGPAEPLFRGRYADEFACDAGGWHFVHRHVHLDETNDALVAEVGVDLGEPKG